MATLVTLKMTYNVVAVIGPSCSAPCQSAGLLAAQWNIPLVGYVAQALELSDKSTYNTFVRSNPSISIFSRPMLTLLQRYNWTTVGLLIENPIGTMDYVLTEIKTLLPMHNITINATAYIDSSYNVPQFANALQLLSKSCRGYFYCLILFFTFALKLLTSNS